MNMYTLEDLPYAFDALEPVIDSTTMQIHHGKHHAAYIDNLNKALEGNADLSDKPVEELLKDLAAIPESIRTAVQNHGGGHANHTLFWKVMCPSTESTMNDDVSALLNDNFGSVDDFKKMFTEAAVKRFGSGWAWLVLDNGKLKVTSTANQDSPLSSGQAPILGLDVWEHAYYLKYQNRRPEYVEQWWSIVNWNQVLENYMSLTS